MVPLSMFVLTALVLPFEDRWAVEGGVDAYWGLNLNQPSTGDSFIPGIGTTAKRAGEVTLNLVSLGVSLTPKPFGFKALLGFGTGMEVLHAADPEVWRFVQQASVCWKLQKLELEAGVYPSHIGLESLQSQRNWTYTRSWMGELSPYYQTGVRATYRFSDVWSAQLHVLNGWQVIAENNRSKAIGTQIAFANENLSVALNTFAGPETPGDDLHWRFLGDLVAVLTINDRWRVAATVDAALQQRAGLLPGHWYGAGLNGRFQVVGPLAIAARIEFFRDVQGIISGTPQVVGEGTVTLAITPSDVLTFKVEARHDVSSAPIFLNGRTAAQTLIVLGANAYL